MGSILKAALSQCSANFKGLFLSAFAGFLIRLIPELLAFPHPIGFDTIYYAAVIKSGVIWPHWSSFFTSTWLFNALTVPLHTFFGFEPFAILKIAGPLLFALNTAGVYWFSWKLLGWDHRQSMLASIFFSVQIASLRISWDLMRNTLGLGLLLFTLPFIKRLNSKQGIACFSMLSLLTVFAHEYAAVTLFFIVFGVFLWSKLKGAGWVDWKRLLMAVAPALAVFLIGVYFRFYPIRYKVETNVLAAGDVVYASVGKFFFLTNYLAVKTSVDWYSSYFDLALSVTALFIVLYLSYLFLVRRGFFKNHVLDLWTILLLVGSFSCLIVPFCALQYWHRWMFMLVYPFTFYAANGFTQCWRGSAIHGRFSKRKVSAMIIVTFLLGALYLVTPVLMSTVNVGLFSLYPVNRYISFAPTVPYQDVDGVEKAMRWLDISMNKSDCVLLQHAFLFWGQLYLNRSHTIVYFVSDVDSAVETAYRHDYSGVFFVWWNEPIGWYGLNVPEGFVRVQDFGRISVYKYVKI